MGWATGYIAKLKVGETVQFRPRGNSMAPLIESGDLVTVAPLNGRPPLLHEIVLCKVRGREYLHLVTAMKGSRFQIGNNKGHTNGWVGVNSIFGIATHVQ